MVDTIRSDTAVLGLLASGGDITAQNHRDQHVSLASKTGQSLRQFGAVGNGTTNDQAAIQAAIDFVSAGSQIGAPILDGNDLTYRVNSSVILKSGVTIRNATFDFSNVAISDTLFDGGGSLSATTANLTANAGHGAISLTVNSTTGFTSGDWCMLQRNQNWSTEAIGNVAELVRIRAVQSATVLRLHVSLDYDYTTADSGRITKINPIRDVHFEKCVMIGNPAIASQIAMNIDVAHSVTVRDCRAEGWVGMGFSFRTCWHVLVEHCEVGRGGDTTTTTKYGVLFQDGCHYCTARDCTFSDIRHGVCVSGTPYINRHINIINCHSFGTLGAAIDTHASADHILIDGCDANTLGLAGTASDGIIVQAPRAKIVNCTVTGTTDDRPAIFCESFLSYGGVETVYTISNNHIFSSGTAAAIRVLNRGTPNFNGIKIQGNEIVPNGATTYDYGIEVETLGQGGRAVGINGNTIDMIVTTGIWLHNQAGDTIDHGTINSNIIRCTAQSAGVRGIYIDAAAAGDIESFPIIGNSITQCGIGIEGSNDNFLNIRGNVFRQVTTPTVVDGAQSVAGDNI